MESRQPPRRSTWRWPASVMSCRQSASRWRHQAMYEQLTKLIFPLLKADTREPLPPAGYDPHEFMRTMRAAPSYLRYRLFFWKLYAAAWTIGILALCFALIVLKPL